MWNSEVKITLPGTYLKHTVLVKPVTTLPHPAQTKGPRVPEKTIRSVL